ncbi:ligand-binding sensor domain-containing protein [Arachidicoccus sp.]|uniref:ligand-binding sensor domain-containing protein n=1 Tax=Arachidicoccus sp. TaxID=1872624 RepID=UPI003D214F7F
MIIRKKCLKVLFFSILFLIALHTIIIGQPYYFRHYQVENGLSNNTVFCCIQDKYGFIWMGTKEGLDRFNGYSFDVFRSKDSSGLGDSYIRSLYLSKKGEMYVGTRIGVYKYLPSKEKFLRVLSTNKEVSAIQKDGSGNLWLISGNSLIFFNENSHQKINYSQVNHFLANSVCFTPNKEIWVATPNGLLKKWLPGKQSFITYNLFKNETTGLSKWIEKIVPTTDGKILVGTANYGAKYFNPQDGSYMNILIKNKSNNGIYVRDFLQATDSTIWMATESGLFIYNLKKRSYINLTQQYGDVYSLSDNAVYALCKDEEGGIWAGTYSGGTNYYHPQYSFFEKYFPLNNSQTSLSGNVVREICPDNYGSLWIGTEDAGLNQLHLKNKTITHFKTNNKNFELYPNIHALLNIGSKLLIGTFEHGLDILDIPSGKIIHHYPDKSSEKVLKSSFFVSLCHTTDGSIYAGTRFGLYTFNLKTGTFKNANKALSNFFIHALLEDNRQNLWIGTMGNGLYQLSLKTHQLKNLRSYFAADHGAGINWITTIFNDDFNNIWIGTEGSGLFKYNKTKKLFENYSTNTQFPGSTIYKILEDAKHSFWITTSKGLVHFNPLTRKIIKIYTTANGLLSDQFNYSSAYKDSCGRMYFGSVKGMISFNPEHVDSSDFTAPIFISSLNADNKNINFSIEKNEIPLVELTHEQSSFSIKFAALSYMAPKMTRYRYRMEGIDKNWVYLQSNQAVAYTMLRAGNYNFNVQAANQNGHWEGKIAQIKIKILPPYWQSKTAYFLYFIVVLAILCFIIRSYHLMMIEKGRRHIEEIEHEKDKEIYKSKIDFFTNVAHEIRTPLTLIKAPLEKIIKQADLFPSIKKYLFTMDRNTDRMVKLSEELLDFRKTEVNGYQLNLSAQDIHKIIKEIVENFEEAAQSKNLQIKLDIKNEPLVVNIDKEAFTKIITNLLNNAIKYAAKNIIIKTAFSQKSPQKVFIILKNDGNIIAPEMGEKIFEAFYRLDVAKNQSGSGLGLTLSRSLALLHKGDLELTFEDNKFNTFILTLPSTNKNHTS